MQSSETTPSAIRLEKNIQTRWRSLEEWNVAEMTVHDRDAEQRDLCLGGFGRSSERVFSVPFLLGGKSGYRGLF
jgi:hypothetical protein